MRFYVEQRFGDRWLHLASFPTEVEADAFLLRMFDAGIRHLRIIKLQMEHS